MKVIIESHCDEAMNDEQIVKFVTAVYKEAENKKFANNTSSDRSSASDQLHIVLNIGPTIMTTNARLEDELGVLGRFEYGKGFCKTPVSLPYILV